jgi:hypothetical protein
MSVSNKQEKKKKIIIDLESSEESFQKIRKHIKTEAAEDSKLYYSIILKSGA